MIAPMVSEPCITLLQLYWTTNDLNPELPNEEPEFRDPETVSEEIQRAEEAVQRSPNLEQLQETLQSWRSYEEQLNENPGPREASLPNPGKDRDLHGREDLRIACRKYLMLLCISVHRNTNVISIL